jgi:hypothetical protein
MTITINDTRAIGLCVRGQKEWFEQHGFDFADFLANGIDEAPFLATGDAQAQMVVDAKRDREHG